MGERTAGLGLPADASAVRVARAAVRAVLTGWSMSDSHWLEGVELVVAELVSNAVRHGGTPRGLALTARDAVLTVAVSDTSQVPPRLIGPHDGGGRGLFIVAALSTAWGWRCDADGKQVWATVAHPPPAPPPRTGTGAAAPG